MIFNIIILAVLILTIISVSFLTFRFSNIIKTLKENIDDIDNNLFGLDEDNKKLREKYKKLSENNKELSKSITEFKDEQKELNKFFTQHQSRTDIALINLIDIPFIENELDPGYPKVWDGKIPYPMNDAFINSEIKVKHFYNIDQIKGDWIKITRK